MTDEHLSSYYRCGRYLGEVIPEPSCLQRELRVFPSQQGIDGNDKITGLSDLAVLMYSARDQGIAHPNHPGRSALRGSARSWHALWS